MGEERGRTLPVRHLRLDVEYERRSWPEDDHPRPQTRAECAEGDRPCPYVSCRHHLYLDVSPRTGAIKLNFPNLEIDDMPETCVLDIAERGGATLEEVGALMNLTRERARQIETSALYQLRKKLDERRLPLMPGVED